MITSASGQSGSVPSGASIASRHSMVSSGFRDGVPRLTEPVAPHPLDISDPHRHAGEFRRIGVYFDAPDIGGTDGRKRALKANRLGFEVHPMLNVLERVQRQIEEVARPAGRIQNRERPQPLKKGAQCVVRASPYPSPRCPRPCRVRRFERGLDTGLHPLPFREQRLDDDRPRQWP